jgi:hypothetical protein
MAILAALVLPTQASGLLLKMENEDGAVIELGRV